MSPKPLKTFEARTIQDWRAWLRKNHKTESEVWLIRYKRHTGRPSIAYEDALDEALCFGWIDSLVKRLDDERYAIKFTPRKPESKWSDVNRKRYAALRKSGRLMPAGLERSPTSRTYAARPKLPDAVPKYFSEALDATPAAREHFERLAPSYRRHFVGWVHIAKREETKQRRLREAISLLAAGKKLGLK
jgi:uncharacterized protein YdeI (YjbR/CyaY-like superfamily)